MTSKSVQGKIFLSLKDKFLIERLMLRLLPLLCCWRLHLVSEAPLIDCGLSCLNGSFPSSYWCCRPNNLNKVAFLSESAIQVWTGVQHPRTHFPTRSPWECNFLKCVAKRLHIGFKKISKAVGFHDIWIVTICSAYLEGRRVFNLNIGYKNDRRFCLLKEVVIIWREVVAT